MAKVWITVECSSCGGTGLYSGMCEKKGEAVICCNCGGKGWEVKSGEKFNGRKHKKGIKTIRQSRGTLIVTGVGGHGKVMTYKEFEDKYPV